MRYVSTRGAAPELGFADVLLTGLAVDGGLHMPAEWPRLPDLTGLSDYADVAAAVMWPFVEGEIDRVVFDRICHDAYATFGHPAVAPLVQIDETEWLLELFHGPTLAFKDIALQLVGRLFEHVLAERDEHVMIIGATSGDTGSAAIDAVRGCKHVDIVILYPAGRTSDVQRRQMTTVGDDNVHAVAIDGTFDDCQDLVKAMFNDVAFRERMSLSAVNSINWARVMAQVVYYVTASRALSGPITFCVPTGNFGNVLSGWIARRMGAPIADFIVASNTNDIITRFVNDGDMTVREVVPTLQPEHGHPGVVELRASPVRDQRARRGTDRRAAATVPGQGQPRARARPAGGVDRRIVPGRQLRRQRHALRDRPGPTRDRTAHRSAHRDGHGGGAIARQRSSDRHAGDRPSRQVPRRRRAGDGCAPAPAGAPRRPARADGAHGHAPGRTGGRRAVRRIGCQAMSGSRPIDETPVVDIVRRVPGWHDADPLITPLDGGITNRNYRIEIDGAAFVVRLPGERTELLGIDRAGEAAASALAADLGIGPAIRAELPGVGTLVTEFVGGKPATTEALLAPGVLERVTEFIRRLARVGADRGHLPDLPCRRVARP